MRLFICEKPSLAGTVASFLGKPKKEDGYYSVAGDCVAWLYGHILGLDEPDDYDPAVNVLPPIEAGASCFNENSATDSKELRRLTISPQA